MEKIISNSENDTKLIGKEMAKNFKKGDVIVLTGDLGSGKTKFTEGVLSFFGLENEISSPTFTIVNEYKKDDISIPKIISAAIKKITQSKTNNNSNEISRNYDKRTKFN